MCACNRLKVGVAELQLYGSRFEFLLAQAPRHHFSESCERGLEHLEVGGVLSKGVLVADGLRRALADLFVKPATCVFAPRFAGHCGSVGAELMLQIPARA